MTIIHNPRRQQVRVIGARHPVYKMYYGDGFGSTVQGLFTKFAPKTIPLAQNSHKWPKMTKNPHR